MLAHFLKKNYQPTDLLELVKQSLASVYPDSQNQNQVSLIIICHVLQCSHTAFFTQQSISAQHVERIVQAVQDHTKHHKPLDYIIGTTVFAHLTLQIYPPILIPRPETEEWVINLIDTIKHSKNHPTRILDIGTGSGAIALTLATALPDAHVYGIDINPDAVALAKKNAAHHAVHNVTFFVSDLFAACDRNKPFDLIVSNPPYIGFHENVDPSVYAWEDQQALYADDEGLGSIKKIIAQAPAYLTKNIESNMHQLYIEIGHSQAAAVLQLMHHAGYQHITVYKDINHKDRVVSAKY